MSLNAGSAKSANQQLDFIKIEARVSADGMSAFLSLEPVEGVTGTLTAKHLRSALENAKVTRGIDSSMLKEIAGDWSANPRSLKTAPVARGVEAQPEDPGELRMQVRHLSAPGDISTALNRRFFWEIASMAHKFQRVDHGTVIARRTGGSVSLIGYNVYGTPLLPDGVTDDAIGAGKIVERDNVFIAGHTYTSAVTGIAYVDNDEPKVHPLDFNGTAELKITSDMMSAEIIALPAGEGGSMPSETFIRNLLKSKGVVYGISEEAFSLCMIMLSKGVESPTAFMVARGIPPVKGSDGRVEFCFNTETSPAPIINPDGSADYKNINLVTAVGVGTILAKLHPPSKGTPGMDITGHKIPALDGAPAMLPVGANTAVPKETPNTLVAVVGGIVRFDGSSVNIAEGYVIKGDVNYASGNVNYENSVTVNGDVKSGFEVNCGGDLQVNGIMEDCKVTVKGNVLCKYGFVGRGKGIIEAVGDVNLGYMKNQTLITKGNVNIAKEAINCNITARKSINIFGHTLSAVGGTLITNGAIVLKTVGNISHVLTTLQIDPEPEYAEELDKIKEQVEHHKTNIKKLTLSLETMPPAQKNDKELVRKLKNAMIVMQQQITALEDRTRLINIMMNKFENSFIRIERCAYPGTIIKFGQKTITLTETLNSSKTIKVINNEIKIM